MRDVTRPEVWAPNASSVQLLVDGAASPMRPSSGGWWSAEPLPPGTRYRYVLDDGDPRPDPRSLHQPEGPHGPSRIVDPDALRPAPWEGVDLRGRPLYELHVGAFTPEGTFDSAIGRLDHLVELGIAAVEIMPVADFPGLRGWGYDGVGQYATHRAYGGPEAFVRFIDACHARGLGVLLDVVYNHFGPEGNYWAEFGPYFTDRHQTPWGSGLNLDDEGSPEVRGFLLGAARQWLVDFRLDGLRLDAVHAMIDDSDYHFLAELSDEVAAWAKEQRRPLFLTAESDLNQPYMVSPVGSVPKARGMGAQWADDVHHALHGFFTGETQGYYVDFGPAHVLRKALTGVFVHDGDHSTFRDRDWGAPLDPDTDLYDGHSFVAFLQNHDQVGNRATGDRIEETITPAEQAAAAALYLLSAYTPMVFMGEEWAATSPFPYFSQLGDELGPLVTEGRRREFSQMEWDGEVPDPQSEATFLSAVLPWDERDEPAHARMLAWYRTLLALRRDLPGAGDPGLRSTSVDVLDDDTVVMRRPGLAVAVTCSHRDVDLPLTGEVLAAWDEPERLDDGRLRLAGQGVVIVAD